MLRKIAKQFLLNENIKVDPAASVQALYDIEHLRGIKRELRSLNEHVQSLEEELNLLKEEK